MIRAGSDVKQFIQKQVIASSTWSAKLHADALIAPCMLNAQRDTSNARNNITFSRHIPDATQSSSAQLRSFRSFREHRCSVVMHTEDNSSRRLREALRSGHVQAQPGATQRASHGVRALPRAAGLLDSSAAATPARALGFCSTATATSTRHSLTRSSIPQPKTGRQTSNGLISDSPSSASRD